jgi:hypothetical protein
MWLLCKFTGADLVRGPPVQMWAAVRLRQLPAAQPLVTWLQRTYVEQVRRALCGQAVTEAGTGSFGQHEMACPLFVGKEPADRVCLPLLDRHSCKG